MPSTLVLAEELGTGDVAAEPKLCPLQYAAGRIEACPRESCPFWEEGGVVLEAACALDRLGLDLDHNPQLAHWLLKLRRLLIEAKRPTEREEAHHLFERLLPPGVRG